MKPAETLLKALAVVTLVAATSATGCARDKSDRVAGPPRDDRSAGKSGGDVHAGSGARRSDMARPAPKGGCIPAGMVTNSMAFPTGERSTSAVLVTKGLPPEVIKGQEFDYYICVTNLTNNDLENVVLTDDLSRGFTVISASPDYTNKSGNVYAWNLGDMGAGDTQRIRVRAKADADDMLNACASVTYNSAVCVATKVVQPALQLAKAGPAEVIACEQIIYRYRVTNTGTGAATDVAITDEFPSGLTTESGSRTLSIPVGTLAAGQSREFTVTVNAARPGRFESAAQASAKPGLTTESKAVATVVRKPKLTLAVDCPENRFFGRGAEVCATLSNEGDGVARGAVIEASLPPGATFKSASNNGKLAGNKIVWSLGDLAPDADRKVCYVITTDSADSLRNYVVANAACADQASDDCTTSYEGIPAILVECIDLEDPDEVGTTETYVVTVTNQGTAPDSNIRLVCDVPSAMAYQSSQGPTQATARGQTVTFAPLATLAPKATATWRITLLANEPGDVRFRIRVTSDQFKDPPIEETESTNLYR